MKAMPFPKIKSLLQLYDLLTDEERIITDVLRQIISETLPAYCKEKISYNVPFFFGNKSICLVWPASVPRGGIQQGVLLGFWYGNRLNDVDGYLIHGNNKQIFYKVYYTADEIDQEAIVKLLAEAMLLDAGWAEVKKPGK